MRRLMRFRVRTLLVLVGVLAAAAGGGRWWYDQRLADYEAQMSVCAKLEDAEISALWSYQGPMLWDAWKWLDGPLFRQPTHVYCDDATDDAVAEQAGRLAQINVETLTVLGRQILPQARVVQRGEHNALIEALRRHPTLKHLVVDASIRGTPLEFDAPTYTSEDLALLEELLPNLDIQWIEVN
jgi:hypothetical protein